jgi:hypothetical protein
MRSNTRDHLESTMLASRLQMSASDPAKANSPSKPGAIKQSFVSNMAAIPGARPRLPGH